MSFNSNSNTNSVAVYPTSVKIEEKSDMEYTFTDIIIHNSNSSRTITSTIEMDLVQLMVKTFECPMTSERTRHITSVEECQDIIRGWMALQESPRS